jgi:hypothetical protein
MPALRALLMLALLVAAPARAQTAVLELFTSQGCSSCPPADRLLGEFAQQPGVLVLTWPVTFWDRLGWKDTLAKPAYTQRQIAYVNALKSDGPFTPQLIINGAASEVGSRRAAIQALIAQRPALPVRVQVTQVEDRGFTLDLAGPAGLQADVKLVRFTPAVTVPIGRGENSGRTVTYTNVVRGVLPLAPYRGGTTRAHLPIAIGKDERLAVLVQAPGQGRILGVGQLP